MADKKKKKDKVKSIKPHSFKSIEAIHNTAFTGKEQEDSAILDGIMDFIYGEQTTEADKVAAAKYMAKYFGNDDETIDIDYVNNMMKEFAAATDEDFVAAVKGETKKGKGKDDKKSDKKKGFEKKGKAVPDKEEKPDKKKEDKLPKDRTGKESIPFQSSKKWFGVEDNREITAIAADFEKRAQSNLSTFQKDNMKTALEMIATLEKKTKAKINVTKKQKLPGGGLIINFTSPVFLANMGDRLVRVIGTVGSEYELRIGA